MYQILFVLMFVHQVSNGQSIGNKIHTSFIVRKSQENFCSSNSVNNGWHNVINEESQLPLNCAYVCIYGH